MLSFAPASPPPFIDGSIGHGPNTRNSTAATHQSPSSVFPPLPQNIWRTMKHEVAPWRMGGVLYPAQPRNRVIRYFCSCSTLFTCCNLEPDFAAMTRILTRHKPTFCPNWLLTGFSCGRNGSDGILMLNLFNISIQLLQDLNCISIIIHPAASPPRQLSINLLKLNSSRVIGSCLLLQHPTIFANNSKQIIFHWLFIYHPWWIGGDWDKNVSNIQV